MGSRAALGSCLAAAGRPSPPRLAHQAPRSVAAVPRDADWLRQRLAPPASRMLRSTTRRVRSAPRPWAMAVAGGAQGRAPSGDCGAGRVAVAGRDPVDHEGRRARGGGEPVDGSGHLLPARSGVLPSRAALGSCLAAAGRPSPPRLAHQAPRSRLQHATAARARCRGVLAIPACRERFAPRPWAMGIAGGAHDVRRPATAERDA
jgi:hypothetical protein